MRQLFRSLVALMIYRLNTSAGVKPVCPGIVTEITGIPHGGPEDIAYKNGQIRVKKLDERNLKYICNDYPGGHTWPVWRNDLYHFAQLIFRK